MRLVKIMKVCPYIITPAYLILECNAKRTNTLESIENITHPTIFVHS